MSNERTEGESLTFKKTFIKSNLPFHGEYLTYRSLEARGLLFLEERDTGFQNQDGLWLIFDDLGESEVTITAPNAQSRKIVDGVLERFEWAGVNRVFRDIGGEMMTIPPVDLHIEAHINPSLDSLGRFFSLSPPERRGIQGLKVQRFIGSRLNRITQNRLMRELLLRRYQGGRNLLTDHQVEAFEDQIVRAVLAGAKIGDEAMDQESYRKWVEKVCGEAIAQEEQGVVKPPIDRESVRGILGYRSLFDGGYKFKAEDKEVDEEERVRLKGVIDRINITRTPDRIKKEVLEEIGVREPWSGEPMTLDEKRRFLIYEGLTETNIAWSFIEGAWQGSEDRMVDLMHYRRAEGKPSRLQQLRLLSRTQQVADMNRDPLFGDHHLHQEELNRLYREIAIRGVKPITERQTRTMIKKIVAEAERTISEKHQTVEQLLSLPF